MIERLAPVRVILTAAALTGLFTVSHVCAQNASGWDQEPHTAARLIAGAAMKDADATLIRAGVEIKLDPGWHTYWRDPGDSGVPPAFDFSGSGNVKMATVQWPAPMRFPDGAGGQSIGYVDHVILPVVVAPSDAAKQSSLVLKLDYAICNNLCIPAEAKLQLALDGHGAEDVTIEKAEVRVPRRVELGPNTGSRTGLAILGVHREPGTPHDRVVIHIAAPIGVPVELFVEGPTPDWSLPQPQSSGGEGATRRFTFDLDGLPPGAKPKDAILTLTAVSADDAIEVPAHLD